jgi:hypothetical protein
MVRGVACPSNAAVARFHRRSRHPRRFHTRWRTCDAPHTLHANPAGRASLPSSPPRRARAPAVTPVRAASPTVVAPPAAGPSPSCTAPSRSAVARDRCPTRRSTSRTRSATERNAELPHDATALLLDGLLGRPELRGDLLVHAARDDQPEDVTLARRQGREARRTPPRPRQRSRRAAASRSSACPIAASSSSSLNGWSETPRRRPSSRARIMGIVPCPVMNTTGITCPARCSSDSRSRPLPPGRLNVQHEARRPAGARGHDEVGGGAERLSSAAQWSGRGCVAPRAPRGRRPPRRRSRPDCIVTSLQDAGRTWAGAPRRPAPLVGPT